MKTKSYYDETRVTNSIPYQSQTLQEYRKCDAYCSGFFLLDINHLPKETFVNVKSTPKAFFMIKLLSLNTAQLKDLYNSVVMYLTNED